MRQPKSGRKTRMRPGIRGKVRTMIFLKKHGDDLMAMAPGFDMGDFCDDGVIGGIDWLYSMAMRGPILLNNKSFKSGIDDVQNPD